VPISVYSQQQDLKATPLPNAEHSATRRLSILILRAGLARQFGQDAIQLTTDLAWPEVKRLARSHVDPLFVQLAPKLAIRDYPINRTCMEEAFQRCMRYPVDLAKDQRSFQYSYHASQPSPSQPLCA
jgi:hypothetical protein